MYSSFFFDIAVKRKKRTVIDKCLIFAVFPFSIPIKLLSLLKVLLLFCQIMVHTLYRMISSLLKRIYFTEQPKQPAFPL